MKNGKVLRILAVVLLIISVMPAVPFAVHAEDAEPKGTIVGWRQFSWPEDEITEIGIDRVELNGEELPMDGGSFTFGIGDIIRCDVYYKSGYKAGWYVEVGIFLATVDSYEADPENPSNYINYNYSRDFFGNSGMDGQNEGITDVDDGFEFYVVIPIEKMSEEELAHTIDSVDLTIKAPEAGTKFTAEPDEKDYYIGDYNWDTQDPYPDVTIPSGVNYYLDGSEDWLYGYYFWPDVPDDFEVEDLELYVSTEEDPELKEGDKLLAQIWLGPEDEYLFSENVKVNVTGGTLVKSELNEYLCVYIMVTVGTARTAFLSMSTLSIFIKEYLVSSANI